MLNQPSLPLTDSAISSAASAAGAMPSDLQDGLTIEPPGPEAAHANLSARQAKEMGLLTSGTCGPRSFGSSSSVALASSLANRLAEKTALLGSTLFKLTWRVSVTPLGRSHFLLRASGRRTDGTGCTSWATPMANDESGSTHCYSGKNPDGTNKIALKLPGQAQLTVSGEIANGSPAGTGRLGQLGSWPTPQQWDSKDYHENNEGAAITKEQKDSRGGGCANLGEYAKLTAIEGDILTDMELRSPGQLNPELSRWLMGLPPEWCVCAVTAMQSADHRPRRS